MSARKHVPERYETSEAVLIALRRIVRSIDMHSRRLAQDYGVSGPQALILRQLTGLPVSAGDLARRVNVSQATITDILDRLERRGLVQRVRSNEDKRRVLVNATAEGLRVIEGMPSLLQEHFVDEFRKLQEWEQTLILSSLQRVAVMMDAQAIEAVPVLEGRSIEPGAPVIPDTVE